MGIIATSTKICTSGSLQWELPSHLHSQARRVPPTRRDCFSNGLQQLCPVYPCDPVSTDHLCPCGPYITPRLSGIHYRSTSVRRVSCYTLLSRCQLPWPQTRCHHRGAFFGGSMSEVHAVSTGCSVDPALPDLLTRRGPLGHHSFTGEEGPPRRGLPTLRRLGV